MSSLYPVLSWPSAYPADDAPPLFYPAPDFDWLKGDFVRDALHVVGFADGAGAFRTWCIKTLHTQRGAASAYPEFGVDFERAMRESRREAVETTLEREITSAIMRHPAARRVKDFVFDWHASNVALSFVVEAHDWAKIELEFDVKL